MIILLIFSLLCPYGPLWAFTGLVCYSPAIFSPLFQTSICYNHSGMEEIATVKNISGRSMTVEMDRKSACASCKMCAMSGEGGKMVLELENLINAVPGDKVALELPENSVLMASLLAYAVPFVFFAAGIAGGYYFFSGDQAAAALCGIMFMAAGFFLVKFADKKLGAGSSMNIKARKF